MDYSEIPEINCAGKCGLTHCTQAVALGEEIDVLDSLSPVNEVQGMCAFLKADGKCSIYAKRPLSCRMWGAIRIAECPHGCGNKNDLLTLEEARNIYAKINYGSDPKEKSYKTAVKNA